MSISEKLFLFTFLGLLSSLFGSPDGSQMFPGVDVSNTDILERSINFILFAVVLWYCVADKFAETLKKRRVGLSSRLFEAQNMAKLSREKKEKANARLQDASVKAQAIVNAAMKEAYVAKQEIDRNTGIQVENIMRSYEDAMLAARRKMEREVISEVLDDMVSEAFTSVVASDYTHIISRGAV